MVELDNDQISDPTWLEGLENIKNRKSQNFLKISEFFLKNRKVHVRGPVGPLKDQGWSWTLWRYGLLSLESLGMFFCCLVCKNIANTGGDSYLKKSTGPFDPPTPVFDRVNL